MTEGEVTVEPGRTEWVDQILSAYEWLFAAPGAPPPEWDPAGAARRRVEEVVSSGGEEAVILVARRDDQIVGICSAYLDVESVRYGLRCWVEDLAVDPGARSQGIGAALLTEAQRWGRERGATHLELDSGEARTDAHRFYEREAPDWRSKQYTWLLEEEGK